MSHSGWRGKSTKPKSKKVFAREEKDKKDYVRIGDIDFQAKCKGDENTRIVKQSHQRDLVDRYGQKVGDDMYDKSFEIPLSNF